MAAEVRPGWGAGSPGQPQDTATTLHTREDEPRRVRAARWAARLHGSSDSHGRSTRLGAGLGRQVSGPTARGWMMMAAMTPMVDVHQPRTDGRIKVWFRFVPREDWLPFDTEGMWATPITADTARIDNVPFFRPY